VIGVERSILFCHSFGALFALADGATSNDVDVRRVLPGVRGSGALIAGPSRRFSCVLSKRTLMRTKLTLALMACAAIAIPPTLVAQTKDSKDASAKTEQKKGGFAK
jgi:hypothetical protein